MARRCAYRALSRPRVAPEVRNPSFTAPCGDISRQLFLEFGHALHYVRWFAWRAVRCALLFDNSTVPHIHGIHAMTDRQRPDRAHGAVIRPEFVPSPCKDGPSVPRVKTSAFAESTAWRQEIESLLDATAGPKFTTAKPRLLPSQLDVKRSFGTIPPHFSIEAYRPKTPQPAKGAKTNALASLAALRRPTKTVLAPSASSAPRSVASHPNCRLKNRR
jgi:hypothetical protein